MSSMITRLKTSGKFEVKDPKETIDRVTRFIRQQYDEAKARKLIIGLSGGLDSSVTAALCAIAVNGRNVLGISMPEHDTYKAENVEDAKKVAADYHIQFKLLDITHILEATGKVLQVKPSVVKKLVRGNLKARIRMNILYYHANSLNGLVVGTGDKSEAMLGYFTKYGDGACDIQPLADI
ncbi:MAG TPA: NAD(+) synthase, partial [Candidatus Binatus sp.]|nr:NAD(+) synthase [Candidatus Binatus sp.]